MTVAEAPRMAASAAAYRASVLASQPQAYWPLDDAPGSGTAHELMSGANATVQGAVAFNATDPWGTVEAAHFLDQTTSVHDTYQRAHTAGQPYSVEFWYRTTMFSGSMAEFNIAPGIPIGNDYSVAVTITSQHLRCMSYFNNAGGMNQLDDPTNSNNGQWHHVVLTHNGSNHFCLYRDGALVAEMTNASAPRAQNGYWQWGAGRAVSAGLTGDVSHFAVWIRELSAEEISDHYNGVTPPEPEPPEPEPPGPGGPKCVRRAWLTLDNGQSLSLEGPGYFCQKLDLGSPSVREQVNNRPDRNGVIDQTMFLGARAVEANITALVGAGAVVDEVASLFGPFMNPAARPTLHYVLERGDNPERTLVLRASAYSWPIIGDNQRDIQLQWSAPDPIAKGATVFMSTAWTGTAGLSGRTYPWQPDRVYPTGSGAPTNGRLVSRGDLPFRPYLRIFGPVSTPRIFFAPDFAVGDRSTWPQIGFIVTFNLDAGHFVGIDTEAHTAYLDDDPTKPVLDQLDWSRLFWPVLDPAPDGWTMSMTGQSGMTNNTQVQATWRDNFFA